MLSVVKYITLTVSLTITLIVSAQDIHFSQFYNAPVLNNPANTGNFNGDWRLVNNYRTQWRSVAIPYNTLSAGYETKIYPYNQNVGIGAYFINDQSGGLGLSVNKLLLSAGYHRMIDNNYWHFGIQSGLVYKIYDNSGMTLPFQFNENPDQGGYFDNRLNSGETNLGERSIYLTFNIGLGWNRKFRNLMPMAEVSFNNINRPHDSFTNSASTSRVPFKQIWHTGVQIDVTRHWKIVPSLFYMRQRKAAETILGSGCYYTFGNNKFKVHGFNFGAYFRKSVWLQADAAIFSVGLDVYKVHGEISYDINVSDLTQASGYRGAFEISIILTQFSTVFTKYTIPCTRF